MKRLCVGLTALSVGLLMGCNGGGGSSKTTSSTPTSKTTPGSTASTNTGSKTGSTTTTIPGGTSTTPGTTGTTLPGGSTTTLPGRTGSSTPGSTGSGSTSSGSTGSGSTRPGGTLPGTGTGTLPGTGTGTLPGTGTSTPPSTGTSTPPRTGTGTGTSTPPSTGTGSGTSTPPRTGTGSGTSTPPSSGTGSGSLPGRGGSGSTGSGSSSGSLPGSGTPRGTPGSRGGSGVSTGSSTTGTLQITVSPSSGAVGDMIAIQMAQINPNAYGVGMALFDAQGNIVQVPNQTLSQTNPNELDFAVPQTAAAGYSVVVELVDQNQKLLDYAMAPFTVTSGGTRRGGGSAPGSSGTSTGSSSFGTLQIAVTPGGANAGDMVAVQMTGLDPNAYYVGMQLIDTSGNPIQVPNQQINPQTSSSSMIEIDFVVPQTPAGAYVVDVQELDQNYNPVDDCQAPFTVGSGSTRGSSGSGSSGSGSSSGGLPAGGLASTTGVSVSGQPLQITVTPGGGNAGASIQLAFANLDPSTTGIGMALVDPNGNIVQVSNQQLDPSNPNAMDFVIPQTPNGAYQVVFGEFDQSGNIIDEALAPFTVGASSGGSRSGGGPRTGGVGSQTGVSVSGGQMSFTVTPGGGQVGDTIQLVFANLDSNTVGIGMALIDANGNLVNVTQQQLDPQNPNALDFVIPQTPSGAYQVIFGEFDQSGNIIDEAVSNFTVQ